MSIFQPVTLKWNDEEYIVPANQVMGLIAQIEDAVTLNELMSKKGPPLAKVAMGYGAALRYAGAKVKDDEVYQAMFGKQASSAIQSAVAGLLSMMIPPEEVIEKGKKPRRKGA
jgi:hypothetical protein